MVATGLPIALPLARTAGATVTVDEYHHGVGESAGSFGYLPGWLQLVVLQLAVALIAAMITAARRLGSTDSRLAGGLARLEGARREADAVEALAEIEQATRSLTGANR